MSPLHAAEHEGVMSRGGMKKNGMPSICFPPRAAGGKKEGTREVQLCVLQLVLDLCPVRQDGRAQVHPIKKMSLQYLHRLLCCLDGWCLVS